MIPGETEFAKILAEKLSAEVRQEAPAEKAGYSQGKNPIWML